VVALLLAGGSMASASAPDRRPVPILMYHVVTKPPPGAAFPGLYVSRAELAAEVAWLAGHGYRAVTLKQVFDAWTGRGALPRKPVVLSFDDGYRSQFVNAFPLLRARRWPGVVNLELGHVTADGGLTPRMLRQLIAAGWEIDAHTLTHPDLRYVDDAALRREVAGSRAEIRRRFGVPAEFFCYPAGRYDERVVAAVRAAGYRGATTVEFGLARSSEPFTLARVRINAGDGAAGVAAKFAALGLR
jgi:peptidoglycan/xylan/chitin deacetylase (PgdA/CDA1 family)